MKKTVYLYISLLVLGFLGLCLPGLMHLSKCNGLCAAIWILSFLILTQCFSSVRHMLINVIVFVVGYLLKYIGALSFEWIYAVLFLVMGLLQFGVFFLYSRLMSKYCRFIITLAFPVVWMILYILAMLVRFPSLIRVDLMFADMNVLLQAESLIGSFGLSFVLLWIFAIFAYAICNRKSLLAILGALLYFALLTIGVVYLSPNVNDSEFVRVAFSTGPYVGDYLEYTSFPVDRYLSSMQSCVEEASGQGAEIIVFNEETYEIDDTDEEAYLSKHSPMPTRLLFSLWL